MKKEYRVSNYEGREVSPEETLVDSLGSSKIEAPISQSVPRFSFALILSVLGVFLFTAFRLQILQGESFRRIAFGNRSTAYEIPSLRGDILDRNGIVLAENKPVFDLIAVSADLPKKKEELNALAVELGSILIETPEKIAKTLENKSIQESFLIKKNLKKAEVLKIQNRFQRGIYVVSGAERFYPSGPKVSAVIGYVGKVNKEDLLDRYYGLNDRRGRNGLEDSYEKYLRGEHGQVFFDRSNNHYSVKEPGSGSSLVLNIDAGVQKHLYDALSGVSGSVGIKAGAAVVQNPKTGEILGLVSLPSFDNNQLTGELSQEVYKKYFQSSGRPTFNRAISGRYNPGSTIKPLLALAGLKEGVIDPRTTITDLTGFITIKNMYNPDIVYTYRDWKVQGTVDLKNALAQSSDIYFYSVGGGYNKIKGLGYVVLEKYFRLFRIDKILGIDLPGEVSGFVPSEEWKIEQFDQPWFVGDTYNVSIGQGDLLTTPLWLSAYVSAIANGGIFYQPFVVKKIIDKDGKKVREFSSRELGRLPFDEETFKMVKEGMRLAVVSGTAKLLNNLPVEVAAKTGTAEAGVKGSGFNSLFIAYAPYDNPEIAIAIAIENIGKTQGLAIKTTHDFLAWYFGKTLNIDYPQVTP
ncbi:MAG: penicillin-binding protein 2 [Parcubacteria group bacterium Gr01-1014_44]|nr:MAG: penicillin-binding protein 2 [Parcubacteria group bacterium Gr01-1014_44]